jgi:hypothetical protein
MGRAHRQALSRAPGQPAGAHSAASTWPARAHAETSLTETDGDDGDDALNHRESVTLRERDDYTAAGFWLLVLTVLLLFCIWTKL